MPTLIRRLKKAKIVGKDIHKISKPEVAEMGGIGILFGFAIALMVGVYLCPEWQSQLTISLIVILLTGIIGMVDDLIMLSSKEKLILLWIAGLPIMWVTPPNVSIIYMLSIPIAVSIASNLTNMLAGLNGIETGLGVIALTSLTLSCIIMNKYDVAIISFSMLGALIAFLFYNKYPANVFPGDVGTLIIGACIAIIAFIGRVKIIALIVLIPNIVDGFLKFRSAGVMERQNFKPTQVKENGILIAPPGGFNSLIRSILKKPMREEQVVHIIWGIGLFFGLLGIIIAYLARGAII
ncbi:MAG: glycosyltransferase 4 family protein [Methanosphaera sp.]|uniref:MraY family glycosyltransferase n=1 Tax=Candidatus Methanosphaera massiliense TaxID=3017187 RepID=UPI0023801D11|nr:glycosyltransferase 4 family protein [Candidatus Methanosphaera massiliense]MDD6285722.1 multidrug transporter [Methanobacteriaceae archaeon]MDE4078038.1 multidrug transporter [Candidatus Methanosphaera massiliense]